MGSPDVNFNNLSFVENLKNISPSTLTTTNLEDFFNFSDAMQKLIEPTGIQNPPYTLTALNNFFRSFNKTSNPLPSTYDDFIARMAQFLGVPLASFNTAAGSPMITAFLTDFSTMRHDRFAIDDLESGGTSPWIAYYAGTPITLQNGNVDWAVNPSQTPTSMIAEFKAWFAHFLQNFSYHPDGSAVSATEVLTYGNPINNFSRQMINDLANTARLSNTASYHLPRFTAPNTVTASSFQPPSYQDVYNALFPDGGQAGYLARLQLFYQEQMDEHGYFIPSQLFEVWTETLKREYLLSLNIPGVFSESLLVSGDFKKTLILDRIFLLIASMLNSLQRVAAVQAQRLTLFTTWQQAYTQKLGQLPVFLENQIPAHRLVATGGSDDQAKADARDKLNTTVNTRFRSFLETNRNLVSDDAKALQSNLNQSSDAVSQQANMATAIIQELSTLLGAIFR